jgi:hypothetical protein
MTEFQSLPEDERERIVDLAQSMLDAAGRTDPDTLLRAALIVMEVAMFAVSGETVEAVRVDVKKHDMEVQ